MTPFLFQFKIIPKRDLPWFSVRACAHVWAQAESLEAARDRAMGDLRSLQGVSKFPVRIKCALLAFDALQEAIKATRAKQE